jgi:CheY-like chemotaxis protein
MPTILVVDDHADNRAVLVTMLGITGYRVLTATQGQDAVTLALEHQPDLILMDLAMPVMDGWSAITTLKQTPTLAHIPVIVVTAYATGAVRRRALDAGCAGYLGKPIDYERLVQLVASTCTPVLGAPQQ